MRKRPVQYMAYCVSVLLLLICPAQVDAQQKAKKNSKPAVKAETPQQANSKSKPAEKKTRPKAAVRKTNPVNEQQALEFAKLHHKELHQLLKPLKKLDEHEYRRAIRELFNASNRISRYQQRDPERYEAEVAFWKTNSQIKLLLAHLAMGVDEQTQQQLKSLLTQRHEQQVQLLEIETERLQKSRERIDQRIELLKSSHDKLLQDPTEAIEQEYESLVDKAQGLKPRKAKKK